MRRLVLLLSVVLVMATMVVVMVVPAFAVTGNEQSSNSDNLVGELSAAIQHNGTNVSQEGQFGQRSDIVQALLGQSSGTSGGGFKTPGGNA